MTFNSSSAVEHIAAGLVLLGLASAILLAFDVLRRPQPMWIMNFVWPLTALYSGPLGVWAYFAMGRNPKGGMHDTPTQKSRSGSLF